MTDELQIGSVGPYDPIVVRNKDQVEIFRVDSEGNIYSKGRKIEADDEIRAVVKEFIVEWTNSMKRYDANYEVAPPQNEEGFL